MPLAATHDDPQSRRGLVVLTIEGLRRLHVSASFELQRGERVALQFAGRDFAPVNIFARRRACETKRKYLPIQLCERGSLPILRGSIKLVRCWEESSLSKR